ncbi:MAG: transcriptional regulator, family [Herminiimonas sp.]|nr:transcriptional regulator, family [Herminiimonas sp.]
MTQEGAATALGMARTTLVAIEAGKRNVTSKELRGLSRLYSVSEPELLDENEAAATDISVHFRSGAQQNGSDDEVLVATTLKRLANSVVQLEALLGVQPPNIDVPMLTLSRDTPVDEQAEDAALAVRTRLGLGFGPIQDMNAILESELGLRIFERPLPSRISGAMAYSDSAGGFVLVNLKHPLQRRRVTSAHELAHALLRRKALLVHFVDDLCDDREERFCDLFACCFLMPAAAVRKKAAELRGMVGKFTVRELLTMTLYFNVSVEALIRRMVTLKLLPAGTYERLRSEGLGRRHQDQLRAELEISHAVPSFTPRTMLLAMAAHKRQLLTEQQIASMLELDLLTVRKLFDYDDSLGEGDGLDLVS